MSGMLVLLFCAGRERLGEFYFWKWANEQNLCFDHSVWSLSPKKKYQFKFHMFKKGSRWYILLIYKRTSMTLKNLWILKILEFMKEFKNCLEIFHLREERIPCIKKPKTLQSLTQISKTMKKTTRKAICENAKCKSFPWTLKQTREFFRVVIK